VKEVVSADAETGAKEKFAVFDQISVMCEWFIAEAKKFLRLAMKQCLLAMVGVWLCYGAEAMSNTRIRSTSSPKAIVMAVVFRKSG